MNFTREPIIETILSSRDGHKLSVRNSKMPDSEEILVDAVEVVSFGHAVFFRGQERPRPFLVPVSDYEVFEVKETRVVLKNVSHEKNIKIGGGRDAFSKPAKEASEEETEETAPKETRADKKRERRRNRRKKQSEERKDPVEEGLPQEEVSFEDSQEEMQEAEQPTPFAQLLPPPTTLISESIARMKAEAARAEAAVASAEEEPMPEFPI